MKWLHRINEAPPALKALVLLLLAVLVLAVMYSMQARAAEVQPDAPVVPVEEPQLETQEVPADFESPGIPTWGLHCIREDTCLELFSKYFNTKHADRAAELAAQAEEQAIKAEELKAWDAELVGVNNELSALRGQVERAATKLVSCASAAMEGVHLATASQPAE